MAHVTVDLNEVDLLARMKNFEDHLVERKTVRDEKDWKKTAARRPKPCTFSALCRWTFRGTW